MTRQSGFTLIEAMVAGIVGLVIPGVIIALLRVGNTELGASSAQLLLSQIANEVSEDIQRTALAASTAVQGPGACPDNAFTVTSAGTSVVFCDAAGATIKGYRVVRTNVGDVVGRLQERLPGGNWADFVVGSSTVKLNYDPNPFAPKNGGLFGGGPTPNPGGTPDKYVYFNFRYNMAVAGGNATLPMQTETVQCRN